MEIVKDPGNDHEAILTHMVETYEVLLFRTCYMYLRDRDLAEDAVQETFLKAYIDAWQTDLDRMYQIWLLNVSPEDQPMVINHKVMFEGHLNSQITLWNAQYGEGSLMVLRLVNETMEEQCCTLCPVVYALTPTE